jgi:hypothetical protein
MTAHAKPKFTITLTLPDGSKIKRHSIRRYTHVAVGQHSSDPAKPWYPLQWSQSEHAAERAVKLGYENVRVLRTRVEDYE